MPSAQGFFRPAPRAGHAPGDLPAAALLAAAASRGRRLALALGWVLAIVLAMPARGAPPWYQRYNRGLELEASGAWAQALEEFKAATLAGPAPAKRIETTPGAFIFGFDPHYHAALCLVELDRPHMAAAQLKLAAAARVTPPARLQALRQRLQGEIKRRGGGEAPANEALPSPTPVTGLLVVQSDPPGATVLLDGAAAGTTPLGPLPVAPGVHQVRIVSAGRIPVEERLTVAAGATATLVVPLAKRPAGAAPATPRPAAVAPTAVETPHTIAPAAGSATRGASPSTPATGLTATPQAPPAGFAASKLGALPVALMLLAIGAGVGVWAWRRAARRAAAPPEATAPTVAYEHAATLVETGAKLGAYELQGVLGRGGMATTYRARRTGDGSTVAVKVPHDGCLADETFVARFVREGRLGEQLHHPRIVRILAAGEEGGRPYLAMELITGRTLKAEMRERGPMPLRRALEIARDIAEALDYAHAKGVVHRDLKPENVMLLPDGTIKVMDFGIARLTDQPGLTTSNLFLGTPLYAAPEMVDPKNVDHRADLYALGIILYEMLEGAVPFTADSPFRVLEMHLRQPLPSREQLARQVPAQVWAVVEKLCAKTPSARFEGAQPLLVELNRLLQDLPTVEGRDVF